MEFDVSAELMDEQLRVLATASEKGKIRIGVNEVTKAVEREKAKLVLIAKDVEPKEIVMHLPILCREKKIPYSFVNTKKELGEKAGIEVGTSSIAIVEEGPAKKELTELVKKINQFIEKGKPAGKKAAGETGKKEEKQTEAGEKKKPKEKKEKKPAEKAGKKKEEGKEAKEEKKESKESADKAEKTAEKEKEKVDK